MALGIAGIVIAVVVVLIILLIAGGVRVVRPTHRGILERLGKYSGYALPGFHWLIPIVDRMYQINVTEQMVDAEPQESSPTTT